MNDLSINIFLKSAASKLKANNLRFYNMLNENIIKIHLCLFKPSKEPFFKELIEKTTKFTLSTYNIRKK